MKTLSQVYASCVTEAATEAATIAGTARRTPANLIWSDMGRGTSEMTCLSLLYIQRGAYGGDAHKPRSHSENDKAASAGEDFYGVTSWTRDLSDNSRQGR